MFGKGVGMNWAFVDYENVGSLKALKISDYARVFVFCGPGNMRINMGAPSTGAFCRIELIRIGTKGPNNLDFHLAFHLGRFHEVAEPGVSFDLISNDGGFDGLVEHLNGLGRTSRKVKVHTKPSSVSVEADSVVSGLLGLSESGRPRKKASLLNWIGSRLKAVDRESVFDELVSAGIVKVSGPHISYAFNGM